MANEEQLGLLRTGVKAWNRWRAEHPDVEPDLSAADLSGAILSGADLRGVLLDGADLAGADLGLQFEDLTYLFDAFGVPGAPKSLGFTSLERARLRGANLKGAHLAATNLRNADLHRADLSLAVIKAYSMEPGELLNLFGITIPANLNGTLLDGALLYKTTFRDAILCKTSFRDVVIAGTQFLHVDLSDVSGLASASHVAPASIDLETLELTAAGLDSKPSAEVEVFLRDAGLPEEYLDPFRKRVHGGKFYSCFISHGSEDQAFCRKLCSHMKAEGLKVWISSEDLRGGRGLGDQIMGAIQSHDKLLLVLSESSMKSNWVELEIRTALKRESETGHRMLFPISICSFDTIRKWSLIDGDTGQDLAVRIREFFIPDFSHWKEDRSFNKSLRKLLEDLQASEVAAEQIGESKSGDTEGVVAHVWR